MPETTLKNILQKTTTNTLFHFLYIHLPISYLQNKILFTYSFFWIETKHLFCDKFSTNQMSKQSKGAEKHKTELWEEKFLYFKNWLVKYQKSSQGWHLQENKGILKPARRQNPRSPQSRRAGRWQQWFHACPPLLPGTELAERHNRVAGGPTTGGLHRLQGLAGLGSPREHPTTSPAAKSRPPTRFERSRAQHNLWAPHHLPNSQR